ncbi:COX assembly mitochondrial protein homolog [Amphiura filiformis]|uniref:COX assembly mitochondrial protein homolog n=1 Tax=Amphiura filiformis TaxID=82378 RepID=UPI003B20CAC3
MEEGKGDAASEQTYKPQQFDGDAEHDPSILKWKHDDNYLRKVEINTLIPKRMREKARQSCTQYEDEYLECCRNHKVLLFWKCRPQNKAFNECLIKQYEDPKLRESCTDQYLKDRSQFRHTGIPANQSARAKKIEEFQKQKKLQQQKDHP